MLVATARVVFVLAVGLTDAGLSTTPVAFSDVPPRGIFFHEHGWLENTDYEIRFFDSAWHWKAEEGRWKTLNSPFIGRFNRTHRLVLEANGRILVQADDNSDHWEVRWRNNEWEQDLSGDWLPMFDEYDP